MLLHFCAYADADECSVVPGLCDFLKNSSCHNTLGSYECHCDDGLGITYGLIEDLYASKDIRCAGEFVHLLGVTIFL